MLNVSDLEKLENLQRRTDGLLDGEDEYPIGRDIVYLVGRLRDLNNELTAAHRFNTILRAALKESL